MNFTLGGREKIIDKNLVLLTGITRSGTTILGKILASLNGIEYEFEPWLLAQLAIMQGRGAIRLKPASELLRGFVYETYHNALLGRHSNLRPSDDSYIWNYQSAEILPYKWNNLKNRGDTKKYADMNNAKLLMKMPNVQEFYSFFLNVFPDMKIIHIVRHPFDVSLSMLKKHWLCDKNFTNPEATFIRKIIKSGKRGLEKFLPWWVDDGDIDEFLKADEFGRGLVAWRIFIEKSDMAVSALSKIQRKQFMECKYEDFLSNPEKTIEEIIGFMGVGFGAKTEILLKTVNRDKPVSVASDFKIALSEKKLSKLKSFMIKKGYDFPKKLQPSE